MDFFAPKGHCHNNFLWVVGTWDCTRVLLGTGHTRHRIFCLNSEKLHADFPVPGVYPSQAKHLCSLKNIYIRRDTLQAYKYDVVIRQDVTQVVFTSHLLVLFVLRGGFEFKCESAFFYEFCVTKVKILFDIQKLEAILHLLGFKRTKIG